MAQKAGELFVNLGVKGADKTLSAFAEVRGGLGQIKDWSIETKAALVGAFYELAQLVAQSNALGTNLATTSKTLEIPLKVLQEYTNAAEIAGSSTAEMEGTLLSLKNTMAKMHAGESAPKWWGQIGAVTGQNLDQKRVNDFVKRPQELFQLLSTYLKKEPSEAYRNLVENAFGLKGPMLAGMLGDDFSEKSLKSAGKYAYSDRGVKALDQNRREWTKLKLEIEKTFGDLNVKYGGQLIKDVREVAGSIKDLLKAFLELDKALGIVSKLDVIIHGWSAGFEGITTFVKTLSGDPEATKKFAEFMNAVTPFLPEIDVYNQGHPRGPMLPQAGPAPQHMYNTFNGPTDVPGVTKAMKKVLPQFNQEKQGAGRTGPRGKHR